MILSIADLVKEDLQKIDGNENCSLILFLGRVVGFRQSRRLVGKDTQL